MAKALFVAVRGPDSLMGGQPILRIVAALADSPQEAIQAARAILPGAASYENIIAEASEQTIKDLGLTRGQARVL